MEDGTGGDEVVERRKLSEVVTECVSRWFQETLKEAEAGNIVMQVLLIQMYFHGYGVSRDPEAGKSWMDRVAKYFPWFQAVCEKRPGYGNSDSDSDESSTT
ncbi:unnamed protein product [Cochlearia groenlandica]